MFRRQETPSPIVKMLPVLSMPNLNPQLEIGNIGTDNISTLATLPHSLVGRGLRPRRLVGRAVLGEPPPGFHKSHDITSSATVSLLLCHRGLPLLPPVDITFHGGA